MAVTVSIQETATPTTTEEIQHYCITEAVTLDQLIVERLDIRWYANETSDIALDPNLLVSSQTYFATQTINGCESTSRAVFEAVVWNTDLPQAETEQVFCDQDNAPLEDIVVYGENIVWYNSPTSIQALDPSQLLETGTYYASQTINGCVSTLRLAVHVTVLETLQLGQTFTSACSNSRLQDVQLQGLTFNQLHWYISPSSQTPLSTNFEVSETMTLYVSTVNGICVSERVPVLIEILPAVPQPNASTHYICGGGTVLI